MTDKHLPMKILHLTLKKKWFDMIASGEKKEEYREIKPYWASRLLLIPVSYFYPWHQETVAEYLKQDDDAFDYSINVVSAKNGYAKDCPAVTWNHEGIRIGKPNPAWCEPEDVEKDLFILTIGKIII